MQISWLRICLLPKIVFITKKWRQWAMFNQWIKSITWNFSYVCISACIYACYLYVCSSVILMQICACSFVFINCAYIRFCEFSTSKHTYTFILFVHIGDFLYPLIYAIDKLALFGGVYLLDLVLVSLWNLFFY